MAKMISKKINSQYNPTFISGYPIYAYGSNMQQYGFGSWLGENAGMLGTVGGGIAGAFLGDPMLGAQVGGQLGGAVQQGVVGNKQAAEQYHQNQIQQVAQNRLSNLPSSPTYLPTFGHGGFLMPYAMGGSIHINPENKGKFTATKKATGKTTEELTHSKNPLTRKRAIFAQNARKWHHADGGELNMYAQGGGLSREEDYGSSKKPYPSVKSSDFAGGGRSYPIPTKADAIDALRLAGLHGRDDVKAKVYAKYPDLKKANGGPTDNSNIDMKPYNLAWNNFHAVQPVYTQALANKYPNIPIEGILQRSMQDPSFSNTKLNQYADSLVNKYGDFSLTPQEMDSLANKSGMDIRDIERRLSAYDKATVSNKANIQGTKETGQPLEDLRFGPRMMLHRRYMKGETPYGYLNNTKAMGGELEDNTTVYATGGSHETNPLGGIPIGKNGLVEQGEVRFDSPSRGGYIFSDRIPYKKKK